MRGKKIEEMELPLEIRKIGEGDVRNVYLVEAPQARFVLKEWKNKASKADQISIYEKLKLEEKECEKYFKTYASVLSELIVNNLDEMTDVQLSYLLTIQEYVEPSNNLQNIKKKLADLLDYTYERLMLATTGETVIFPDLNIDNFILASDKIFFIDCSISKITGKSCTSYCIGICARKNNKAISKSEIRRCCSISTCWKEIWNKQNCRTDQSK